MKVSLYTLHLEVYACIVKGVSAFSTVRIRTSFRSADAGGYHLYLLRLLHHKMELTKNFTESLLHIPIVHPYSVL